MSEDKLNTIGQQCYQGYSDDLGDPKRQEWAENIDEYIKLSMQIIEKDKTDPWPGCANIKTPLLTEAAIQFNARSYPVLVPQNNIVKTVSTGEDPNGAKAERGERIGKHMTYQLQEDMPDWEDDMDKGLLVVPITGCFFKKTFHNAETGKNESNFLMPNKLVVKYDTPSLKRAPRLSEEITFYPREVREKQKAKIWLNDEIVFEDEEKEVLEKFVVQHICLDLRETGYKIPYIVTIHKETQKVFRIVANYRKADIWYNDGTEVVNVQAVEDKINQQNQQINRNNIEAMAIAQQAQSEETPVQLEEIPPQDFNKYTVLRVDPTEYYTRYILFPAPDGGIYGLGLGQLLGPLCDAADTLINQSLDAGSLANNQGGFMAEGAKTPAGTARVNLNEWTKVKTQGMSLKDAIVPFNFRGPSATALALIEFLIGMSKEVANLKDLLSGDAPQAETATTSMIKREEGLKIYNSIYKRVYRSFKTELSKIYDLNALYLPQEVYFNILDTQEAIKQVDYSMDKTDVQPTADPSESTQGKKVMKAEVGLQFVGDPEFDSYQLKKNFLEAAEYPNIDAVLPPPDTRPDPPPDPNLIKTTAEVKKLEAETKKILLETAEVISKVIKNLADAESKEAGNQIGMLKAQADLLIKKGVANETEQRRTDGVAQQPGDASD
jgi:chaperonin GroES